MTHCFTRWLSGAAVLLASLIPAMSANAASADRFIYMVGWDGFWLPPTTEYAEQYESGKMFETREGSNIYEGTFTLSSSWFRFYSALCEPIGPDDNTCWNRNVIAATYTPDTSYFTATGNRDILVSEDMQVANAVPPGYMLGSWFLPVGTYRISVDLNNKRIVAVSPWAAVIVMDGQPEPRIENFGDYIAGDNSFNYVPAGDLAFNPFNMFSGEWYNPAEGNGALDATQTFNHLNPENGTTRGVPFTMQGWKGGVMGFNAYTVESYPDVVEASRWEAVYPDAIYVVGDHCMWDWTTAIVATPSTPGCYEFTLPAGAQSFKIKDQPNWGDGPEFGFADVVIADATGHKVMKLKQGESFDNIKFDTPLENAIECTLNTVSGELILPADAPIALQGSETPQPLKDVAYVFRPGDKFRPNAQSSYAVCNVFDMLKKDADGVYRGNLTLTAGERLQFACELGVAGEATVVCPGTSGDRALHFADNQAYSSATTATEKNAAYWTVPENADGLNVAIEMTLGDKPTVKFFAPAWEEGSRSGLYLRGTHSDWDAKDEWELVASGEKNVWVLRDKTIPAGTDFKVADASWAPINLGAPDFGGAYLYPNEPYTLTSGNSGNLTIASEFTGDVVLSLNGRTYTLTLETPGGNHTGGGQPQDDRLFMFSNGGMKAMDAAGDGLFCSEVLVGGGQTLDLQIFTKDLPISPEEAEWAGSYALSALTDGFVFEFDDMGVAESGYSVREEVTADKPLPLTLANDGDAWSYYYVVVDTSAKKIYVERQSTRYYLVGTLTDGKEISLANRRQLLGASIPACGGIVDFPAGDCNFIIAGSITDAAKATYTGERELAFVDGVALSETSLFGWRWDKVKNIVRGWKGGKIVVGGNGLLDFSTVKSITAGKTVYGEDGKGTWQTTELKPVAAGSPVFSGKVAYSKAPKGGGVQGIAFYLNYDEDYPRQFQIGSTACYLSDGSGVYLNKGSDILVDRNGVMEADMYCGGNAFSLPTLVGSGELDVTIDVDAMKLTMTTDAGSTAPVFEAVAGESSSLDGVIAYPSTEQENVVTLGTMVTSGTDDVCEFNFATPDGSVICPSGNASAVISFDESGTWSGEFATSPSSAPSRRAVRRKAGESAKWQFSLPEGVSSSNIAMSIDRNTNRLTVFSSAHNDSYFILTADEQHSILDFACIENIGKLKENRLVKGSDGAYEGDFTVEEGAGNLRVAFLQSFGTKFSNYSYVGIGSMNSGEAYTSFDLSEDTESELIAFWPASLSLWNLTAPAGNVHVRFSPAGNSMVFSREQSGVENVVSDSVDGGLSVSGGYGCIRVVASAGGVVNVYATSGMLVASQHVEAGVTDIPLPAGFYIAGGRKVLVR